MDGHSLPHVRSLSPPHLTLQMGVSGQEALRTPEDGTVTSTVYRLAHQTSGMCTSDTCLPTYMYTRQQTSVRRLYIKHQTCVHPPVTRHRRTRRWGTTEHSMEHTMGYSDRDTDQPSNHAQFTVTVFSSKVCSL